MSIKWNSDSLIASLNIKLDFSFESSGIEIDSRKMNQGKIFIAISGSRDGAQYIDQAFEKGAVCAISEYIPKKCKNASRVIVVPDALNALVSMGQYKRKISKNLKAIAVTGSAGKTTTKEMLAQTLSNFGSVVSSQASFNNHIGVPLTLSELEENTQFGVFEIGMNNPGEIAPLSKMSSPDIAIITNVAPSHIGNMGSLNSIALEKSSIFQGLNNNGVAIINGDDGFTNFIKNEAKKYNVKKIFTVSCTEGDARIINYEVDNTANSCVVTAEIFKKTIKYPLQFIGEHYAFDSLYVLMGAEILGLDLNLACDSLSTIKPVTGRGQILKMQLPSGKPILVFDDAYNANPSSMKAGAHAFCNIPTEGIRVAVIGQMGELGAFSDDYHAQLGGFFNDLPIDMVHVVGHAALPLYNALKTSKKGKWAEKVDDLKLYFINSLIGYESIFIKGSNSQKLQEIVNDIKNNFTLIG